MYGKHVTLAKIRRHLFDFSQLNILLHDVRGVLDEPEPDFVAQQSFGPVRDSRLAGCPQQASTLLSCRFVMGQWKIKDTPRYG